MALRAAKGVRIHPDDGKARATACLRLDVHAIQAMARDELLTLQNRLGYGDDWGVWEAPATWVPKGTLSTRQCKHDCSTEQGDQVWTEVLRVCLLAALSASSDKYRLSAATIVDYGTSLVRVSALCGDRANPSTGWWARVSQADVAAMLKSTSHNILALLDRLHAQGLIADTPIVPPDDGRPLERDRQGEVLADQSPDNRKSWQPLPDRYTAECGRRVLWLVDNLGPSLLDCFEACLNVPMPTAMPRKSENSISRTARAEQRMTRAARSQIVQNWAWVDGTGKAIAVLPFALHFLVRVRTPISANKVGLPADQEFAWPPLRWNELVTLVALLQTCHAWLLFLASGPRSSTVLSYSIHCLIDAPTGSQFQHFRLEGQLYKTTHQLGGRKRDWPLPARLVRATKQQIRLANLVRCLGNPDHPESMGDDLWTTIYGRGEAKNIGGPKYYLSHDLNLMADTFGLRHLLGPDNSTVHSHRFRKTLARLIALAMSSAQLVLMDTFGHEDPDMTLGYMLSDKTIAADAQRVQRELVILMAVDAINDAENLAGAKGVEIREQTYRFQRVKGKSKLDPEDVYELADQITLGGRTFRQVAPGLICTVPFLEAAPCGKGKGVRADTSNCQSGCSHRLVTPNRLAFVDDQIASMLPNLQRALDEDNPMMVAAWVPQIQNYLYEAPTIYEKWRDHPLIRAHCDHSKKPYFHTEKVS